MRGDVGKSLSCGEAQVGQGERVQGCPPFSGISPWGDYGRGVVARAGEPGWGRPRGVSRNWLTWAGQAPQGAYGPRRQAAE